MPGPGVAERYLGVSMADFTPDDITQRRFNTSFRGFDPAEVRQYLQTLSAAVSQLVEERDQMAAKLSELGERDLKTEFESIGREVSAVLEAARDAADQLRQRATNDATRWRSEAVAEVESELRRARVDAEQLRGDAWATADEMLKQAVSETDRIEATSEKERLRLVGEAEREAHRVVAAGRRESEELLRNAKVEADRLTVTAQTAHDELIERATRQSDAAQERTRALEIRRQELKAELDSIRHALATAEGELEERRSALQLSPQSGMPEESSGPLFADPAEEPKATDEWTPGETVRVVRPGSTGADTRTTVGPVSETPEIVVLSPEEVKERRQQEDGTSEEPAADEPVVTASVADEPTPMTQGDEEPESIEQDATDSEVVEQAAAAGSETQQASVLESLEGEVAADPVVGEPPAEADLEQSEEADAERSPNVQSDEAVQSGDDSGRFEELSGLFARLRQPTSASASAEAPVVQSEESVDVSNEAEQRVATWAGDPFELRARLLLPVSNRALRNIKRQLTEAQNEALEELRLSDGGWDPDGPSLGSRLRPDLVVLSAESFAAGHTAAMEMSGERYKRPSTPKTEPEIAWVTALLGDLNHALSEGRKQDQGARQLGASVSRVFRAWRTDEAERRVAELASARYHVGLSEVLLENGFATGWVISGRGCTECRSAAESLPSEWETLPPAHSNCDCTLVIV